jgi:hypothetical protein
MRRRRQWRRFPVLLGGLLLDAQLFPHRPLQVPVVAFWGGGGAGRSQGKYYTCSQQETKNTSKLLSFTIISIFTPKF